MNVCTYVCTYLCMYVCIYLCGHVHAGAHEFACMYVCMYVFLCARACVYVCIFVCTCAYICVVMCMLVHMNSRVCMYVCVCVPVRVCTYVSLYVRVHIFVCSCACWCNELANSSCMYVYTFCIIQDLVQQSRCLDVFISIHTCMRACMHAVSRCRGVLMFSNSCKLRNQSSMFRQVLTNKYFHISGCTLNAGRKNICVWNSLPCGSSMGGRIVPHVDVWEIARALCVIVCVSHKKKKKSLLVTLRA
jgi:hypothetical protein